MFFVCLKFSFAGGNQFDETMVLFMVEIRFPAVPVRQEKLIFDHSYRDGSWSLRRPARIQIQYDAHLDLEMRQKKL